jgi:hypothetical protein
VLSNSSRGSVGVAVEGTSLFSGLVHNELIMLV